MNRRKINAPKQKKKQYIGPAIVVEEPFAFGINGMAQKKSPVICSRRPGQGGGCRFIPRL